ncbi:glycosyltransferase [Paenibacillus sepulcri]|uniref:Glycosyltransferase n=1 Tax=Paenibacillus sepulcri TaxID=359917 RepID=A0ABS7C9I3_9BACL|nr:glycosyltransferase [Paenibacillus sepulcri]
MKNVLIASYDMEVGGVERSLASMLEAFDYDRHAIDVMLCRHQGDFMDLLPDRIRLMGEIRAYSTFRKPIREIFTEGQWFLGLSRALSKLQADWTGRRKGLSEPGYLQMQLMWKYALPFLPRVEQSYDAAISYLWPHYFVADKVNAATKIAWIHTDYSMVEANPELDLAMWDKFHYIVAVSEACRQSFLSRYESLSSKLFVIENITSPAFVRSMAGGPAANPMDRDSRFKLLTVARLSHAKGIDQAVQALKLLRDRGFPDIAWYVVGYGGDEALIRDLIRGNGLEDSFILLGKQTNPYPYIRSCDLYVQPSRYEGKAVTVTEAKIIGKPILITNYSTAHSQVVDGYDGCIADMSIEGIADGIQRLYRDEALRAHLAGTCIHTDYSNGSELEKLYSLIGVRKEGA